MRIAAICGIALFLCAPERMNAETINGPTAADNAIQSLRYALTRFENVEFIATARRTVSRTGEADESASLSEQRIVFRRAGDRALLSVKSKRVGPRKTSPTFRQIDLIALENGDVLHCSAPLDSTFIQIPDELQDLALILNSKRLAGVQSRTPASVLRAQTENGPVIWTIGGYSLAEYIDRAKDASLVANGDTVDLNFDSDFGNVELSLSRMHGWLPQRFRIDRRPWHLGRSGLLGDAYAKHSIEIVSKVWEGEIKSFAQDANNNWYPDEIAFTCRSTFGNLPEEVDVTETHVEKLTFSPHLGDRDFQTAIVFPMGFPVSIAEAEHLSYRWDGSKAVPGVPIRPRPLTPIHEDPAGSMNIWLVAANIVLILILGALTWRKRLDSRV